jgi:23S rRNA (guanine745-N1)-methyltransferase
VSSPLACSVRACGRPLLHRQSSWTCDRGHAFDIARSGYVNLLQPQDRRSPHAGDPPAALEARRRLHAAGVGDALLTHLDASIARLSLPSLAVIVDLGCGTGELLGELCARHRASGVGIDLAAEAVDRAARDWPGLTWVVANADRRLPLLDGSVQVLLSVNARRNPPECARVLAAGGHLIVAVPASDDLIELRQVVLGEAHERLRAPDVIDAHQPAFSLVDHVTVREQRECEPAVLDDLLTATYRGERHASLTRRDALAAMAVTLAADVLVFRR